MASAGADWIGVAVVVPVLDERESIPEFYRRVSRLGYASSLVFVDNASRDGTAELVAGLEGVRLIRHERNLGYGASIRDGLAANRADRVVVIDADLEYPPEAIPDLLRALEQYPVVYGSRFLGSDPPDMPLARRWGNRLVSGLFNLLFDQSTTDFYTGVKALRREVIEQLALSRDGFEHVVELGAQLSRAGHRIHEIPVVYTPRARGRSKMRHLPEILKYLGYIAAYWVRFGLLRRPLRGAAS
jgi:glycosyltransferase involved in cell wall biosynthesis